MFGKQNLQMAKPAYDSTYNSEIYGSFEMGMHTGYNEGEANFYVMPGIHQAHAFSFFDLSYGLFGYGGGYVVEKISRERGVKGFYGLGARGAGNFNLRFGNFEWRILGIEGAISQEFGGYRNMRARYHKRDIDTLRMYNVNGYSVNIGLSTELVFRSNDNNYTAIKGSLGLSKNNNSNGSNGLYLQIGATWKYEKIIGSLNFYLTGGFGGTHIGLTGGVQLPLSELKLEK